MPPIGSKSDSFTLIRTVNLRPSVRHLVLLFTVSMQPLSKDLSIGPAYLYSPAACDGCDGTHVLEALGDRIEDRPSLTQGGKISLVSTGRVCEVISTDAFLAKCVIIVWIYVALGFSGSIYEMKARTVLSPLSPPSTPCPQRRSVRASRS